VILAAHGYSLPIILPDDLQVSYNVRIKLCELNEIASRLQHKAAKSNARSISFLRNRIELNSLTTVDYIHGYSLHRNLNRKPRNLMAQR